MTLSLSTTQIAITTTDATITATVDQTVSGYTYWGQVKEGDSYVLPVRMRVGGNGALTFTTSQLKTLQPGSYTLEVRPSVGAPYGPTAFTVTSNELVGDPDADRLKIDDAHQTTNDSPSHYQKGFTYELKNVGALSLDRSAYDSSAQQGTKGLLTTSVAGGSVRQRLEVLDSTRPLVFARLGAGDTWNPWELVTTWP